MLVAVTAIGERYRRLHLFPLTALFLGLLTVLLFQATGKMPSSIFGVTDSGTSLSRTIDRATSERQFNLAEWEAVAFLQGGVRRVINSVAMSAMSESQETKFVLEYYDQLGQLAMLRGGLNKAFAVPTDDRDLGDILALDMKRKEAVDRRDELSAAATDIIARQVDRYLESEGISPSPVEASLRLAFPPVNFVVNPPVFFRFTSLPLLLVVAHRDRISVLHNRFLQPSLSIQDMERIETEIDAEGTSSVVLPIGGFAAYPSMVPDDPSLPHSLRTIAHEWVHHYLALRPLGLHYFSDYQMRSVNETVADLAGAEIAEGVLARFYTSRNMPSSRTSQATATNFDYPRAMADIRRNVEDMLLRGDVSTAESYMADRRLWLAANGYSLRKLNTAYLTFYGAYAGSGNTLEPRLRLLRNRSSSLADFLKRVSMIASDRDLAGVASQ